MGQDTPPLQAPAQGTAPPTRRELASTPSSEPVRNIDRTEYLTRSDGRSVRHEVLVDGPYFDQRGTRAQCYAFDADPGKIWLRFEQGAFSTSLVLTAHEALLIGQALVNAAMRGMATTAEVAHA